MDGSSHQSDAVESLLRVKITPRASSNTIVGWLGLDENSRELSIKVTAPAEGSKANAAVIKLLAGELGIPKSAISIERGLTSRHKLVSLGVSSEVLATWLQMLD